MANQRLVMSVKNVSYISKFLLHSALSILSNSIQYGQVEYQVVCFGFGLLTNWRALQTRVFIRLFLED